MEVTLRNGKNLTIREVTINDAEKIVDYMNAISLQTNNLLREPNEVKLSILEEEKFIEKVLKSNHQYMVSVWDEEKLISLTGFHGSDLNRIKHRVSLGISILSEYRGLGLGTYLMEHLCEKAKEFGMKKIELDVRTDNLPAIRIYEKAGFEIEGYRKAGINDKGTLVDLILMGRFL